MAETTARLLADDAYRSKLMYEKAQARVVELEGCVITLCASLDRLGLGDSYVVQEARRVMKGNDLDRP